ncbi:Serine/arginine-rich splicing factor 3 [Triplophysa tibetana]|uniref:Serine/arginine-rich splicing factor 3 n=1 Tax=Triplophysa tibetana TaxID=1572043 RepID=A0A5A9NV59_9TELE|nr:Serine/arginine-rich splicing factor 3 [Triplophysa tibetana]
MSSRENLAVTSRVVGGNRKSVYFSICAEEPCVLCSVLAAQRSARQSRVFDFADPSLQRDCPLDCKVYVGNLGNSGNKNELERSFGYYGPLRSVWVARNPPGFAFVEFEDPRDASDAVRELDGRTVCGCRVRVEMSSGEKRSRYRGPPPSWNRRPRDDNRRRSPAPRRRVHQSALMIQAWPPAHWFLSMPLSGSFTSSNVNLIGKPNRATLTTNHRVLCPPKCLHDNISSAVLI